MEKRIRLCVCDCLRLTLSVIRFTLFLSLWQEERKRLAKKWCAQRGETFDKNEEKKEENKRQGSKEKGREKREEKKKTAIDRSKREEEKIN